MKAELVGVSLIKRPGALIPLAMSLTGLALVLVHAAIFGVVNEADECSAAHVFQILMAAQLPVVAYYAFRWLPKQPSQNDFRLRLGVPHTSLHDRSPS